MGGGGEMNVYPHVYVQFVHSIAIHHEFGRKKNMTWLLQTYSFISFLCIKLTLYKCLRRCWNLLQAVFASKCMSQYGVVLLRWRLYAFRTNKYYPDFNVFYLKRQSFSFLKNDYIKKSLVLYTINIFWWYLI